MEHIDVSQARKEGMDMTRTQRRLEKQAEAARARYAKTRSFVALQRMKDATTKALANKK